MLKLSLLLAASIAGVQAMSAKVDDDANAAKPASTYDAEIGKWRTARVDRLKAPNGWLSLIGLHWLKDGKNTVGAAKSNDIVLAAGPANMGTVTLDKGKLTFEPDPRGGMTNPITVDGKHVNRTSLKDDASGEPSVVAAGSVSFYVIDRNGRKGLRVKDTNAKARSGFTGIEYYPIDPTWRVEAKFTPFNPPHTLEIPNVIGQVDKMPVPGKVEFERDGKKYTLLPVLEEPRCEGALVHLRGQDEREGDLRRRAVPLFGHAEGRQGDRRFQQGVQPAVRVLAARDVPARAARESACASGDCG